MDKIFFYIQEGLPIPKDIIEKFDLENMDFIGFEKTCNFVGIVIKEENVLISWPKHFRKKEEIKHEVDEDKRLLFDILLKYMDKTEAMYAQNNIETSTLDYYPLEAFQNVLQYYKKYGLYREERVIKQKGYMGKINWKDTINKSDKVISNQQLLYIPFEINKKTNENVFLSECMAYVINETISLLSFLFSKEVRVNIEYNKELFSNKTFILNLLKSFKGKVFKDINKKLLHNLIEFFENLNSRGKFIYKNHFFESTWETMVEEYLNRNLAAITNSQINFIPNNNQFQFHKKSFTISGWKIEVDHYDNKGNITYILDSKYYQKIDSLNYKQIVYDYFLREDKNQRVNALILPTERNNYTTTHIDRVHEDDLYIALHYLNIKEIMKDCATK